MELESGFNGVQNLKLENEGDVSLLIALEVYVLGYCGDQRWEITHANDTSSCIWINLEA